MNAVLTIGAITIAVLIVAIAYQALKDKKQVAVN